MAFAVYESDGKKLHQPASITDDGKVHNAGFDTIEGVQKVASLVWNPLSLSWERATSTGGSSGGSTPAITTKRIDSTSISNAIFIGVANPGTSESASSWTITKYTFDGSGNPIGAFIASGSWANRAALTYQ